LNIIEIEGLSKEYGPVRAVDDVTLSVKEGEVFGLIGPNGAGKTTLIKMLVGLTTQSSGAILIDGVRDGGRDREIRRKLGYLPENVAFYDNLTALETLRFYAKIRGIPLEACRKMLATVGLEANSKRVRNYSRGMRQRLGLAVALLGKPSILIFDEPTAGLDPQGVRDFQRIIQGLKEEGVTVVLSSHVLREVQEVVDRIGIMRDGKIIAAGSFKELRDRAQLRCRITAELRTPDKKVLAGVREAGAERAELRGSTLSISCRAQDKARVLACLIKDEVVDLEIREPSLEDVFLRYMEDG
jgi:Cu-processing system ATP-binding protein